MFHLKQHEKREAALPAFELAGPRNRVFFDPARLRCGIVTCGGLCPGMNNVVRGIVLELANGYGVTDVLGFRYGYATEVVRVTRTRAPRSRRELDDPLSERRPREPVHRRRRIAARREAQRQLARCRCDLGNPDRPERER